jgi:hypothetical protein
MDSNELDRLLRQDPLICRHFVGVYARDRLPRRLPFGRCSLVANTDPAAEPGTHWVAIYFDTAKSTAEYFDSYGQAPSTYRVFENYLRRHARHVDYNEKQVQAIDSTACGQYCVYYLHQKGLGKSLAGGLLTRFGANPARNDLIVGQWFNNQYNISRRMPNILTLAIERHLRQVWQ